MPTAHERRHEMNAHQRGAWCALWLWQGSKLSTRDIARLTGITPQGAHKMMTLLAGSLPITLENGLWQWIERE